MKRHLFNSSWSKPTHEWPLEKGQKWRTKEDGIPYEIVHCHYAKIGGQVEVNQWQLECTDPLRQDRKDVVILPEIDIREGFYRYE